MNSLFLSYCHTVRSLDLTSNPTQQLHTLSHREKNSLESPTKSIVFLP